jgi:FtsH-binding integral membrane protein
MLLEILVIRSIYGIISELNDSLRSKKHDYFAIAMVALIVGSYICQTILFSQNGQMKFWIVNSCMALITALQVGSCVHLAVATHRKKVSNNPLYLFVLISLGYCFDIATTYKTDTLGQEPMPIRRLISNFCWIVVASAFYICIMTVHYRCFKVDEHFTGTTDSDSTVESLYAYVPLRDLTQVR